MPIPIKNPNISTNRYKELLRIEKYYKKYQDKYYKEFKENQRLKERIDEAVEYIDDWLFDVGGMGACMEYRDIKEILEILKGENNEL